MKEVNINVLIIFQLITLLHLPHIATEVKAIISIIITRCGTMILKRARLKLEPLVISLILFKCHYTCNILGDVVNNLDVRIHQDQCILLKKSCTLEICILFSIRPGVRPFYTITLYNT